MRKELLLGLTIVMLFVISLSNALASTVTSIEFWYGGPLNTTYYTNDIPISVSVWAYYGGLVGTHPSQYIKYSLDNQPNVTLCDNCQQFYGVNITVPNGVHTLTYYGYCSNTQQDSCGDITEFSASIVFTVEPECCSNLGYGAAASTGDTQFPIFLYPGQTSKIFYLSVALRAQCYAFEMPFYCGAYDDLDGWITFTSPVPFNHSVDACHSEEWVYNWTDVYFQITVPEGTLPGTYSGSVLCDSNAGGGGPGMMVYVLSETTTTTITTTSTTTTIPCNCSELKEKVNTLEQEINNLKGRMTIVESAITSLKNYVNLIICQLLPKGLVKGMTCPVY